MYDSDHEEGDKYLYRCDKCGYNRGILDYPYLGTRCPECKNDYSVTKQTKGIKNG